MPDTTTPQQKPNELDTLIVRNVDINCDELDQDEGYSHKDYFEVKWSGKPHRIAPGMTRRMPRFLAEHYAKHLADHILIKMEDDSDGKRKGLLQSPVERPRVLKSIILGVDTYFLGDDALSPGDKVAQMVDTLNPDERPMDLGSMPDPLIGVLKVEPKPLSEILSETPINPPAGDGLPPVAIPGPVPTESKTSIFDDSKPLPTRKELLADCDKLGIEVTGKETVEQLVEKIKKF